MCYCKNFTRVEKWNEQTEVSKNGYLFDGWYLDKEYTEKFDFSQPATESLTIYAKWIEEYLVSIPAKISLNNDSVLAISGVNRGDKELSVGINRLESQVSMDNQLTLTHDFDGTIQCLSQLIWNDSITNPDSPILSIPAGTGEVEEEALLSFEKPENVQAGNYQGRVSFTINYE